MCLNNLASAIALRGTARLKNAQLAYLSACQVATNQDERLLDEAIHIAGACQLAGFPQVIGTLWPINDEHSATIAADVYGRMISGGKVDTRKAAEALHAAVRELRNETTKKIHGQVRCDPILWGPYIHMGA
jgi:CHAT domain-containing protein